MEAVTTLPRSRPFSRADLESAPDDGRRYELIDGALVVTPAPSSGHQGVVVEVCYLLRGLCPPDLRVIVAPFDVALSDDSVLQPDLLVARREDFAERDLPTAPLLAVEVMSPSTRRIDRMLKHARYEAAGCPSYWLIDPDEPALTVFELHDGRYVEETHVTGDQAHRAKRPFAVELRPEALRG
jgi:Uma2 family endonuclease